MLEWCSEAANPGLFEEHPDEVPVVDVIGVDLFDRDVALEALDAGRARDEQVRHSPTAEVLDHLVAPKSTTRVPLDNHGANRQTVIDAASSNDLYRRHS
jgi:hypothetical protein